ncbi:hypothetical protein KJA15_03020 [Patescibacteria group bacterium]|nr:hypothetical protein [Patescibacteria group bacterium]
MRKIAFFVLFLLLVVLVLVGAGCGEKKVEEEGAVPSNGKVEEEAESLTDILDKAKDVVSLKYDVVVTAPDQAAITTKVWYKGTNMRVEGTFEGYTGVYLLDAGEQLAYLYVPAQNIAMKMDWSKARGTAGESPTEQSESVMDYNPVTVGTEVLDGKTCLVVEYSTETEEVKMWIWTRYGIPIRTEGTTAKGTTVVEIKNIDFGDISNSIFELPAGVQIMEIPFF